MSLFFTEVRSLSLVELADQGGESERIILRALHPCNLGKYAIIKIEVDGDGVTHTTSSILYWFPDIRVKAGDYVLLYSGSGTDGRHIDDDGDTLHVFHWGRSNKIWSEGTTPALVHISAMTYR